MKPNWSAPDQEQRLRADVSDSNSRFNPAETAKTAESKNSQSSQSSHPQNKSKSSSRTLQMALASSNLPLPPPPQSFDSKRKAVGILPSGYKCNQASTSSSKSKINLSEVLPNGKSSWTSTSSTYVSKVSKKRNRNSPRITMACQNCRISKRKCDGLERCEACKKKGLDCFYDQVTPNQRRQATRESNKGIRSNENSEQEKDRTINEKLMNGFENAAFDLSSEIGLKKDMGQGKGKKRKLSPFEEEEEDSSAAIPSTSKIFSSSHHSKFPKFQEAKKLETSFQLNPIPMSESHILKKELSESSPLLSRKVKNDHGTFRNLHQSNSTISLDGSESSISLPGSPSPIIEEG